MKKIVFILLSFGLAGEMEVDGDLKVTGTVDASGNPITNVGAALSMTDAINGNVLQSALRDDGVYEYKMYLTKVASGGDYNIRYNDRGIGAGDWTSYFVINVLLPLLNDGWKIDRTVNYGPIDSSNSAAFGGKQLYILKRKLSDD